MNEFERSIKVLDLKGEVSKDTIKIAYKKLIKIHHPDFFTNEKNKAKATKNFKKIKKAYDYLLEYLEDSTIDVGSKPKNEKTSSSGLYEKPKMHKSGEPIEEKYAETVRNYKRKAKAFQQKYYSCNGKRTCKSNNKHDFYREEKPKTTYKRTIRKPKRKSSTSDVVTYEDMTLSEAFAVFIIGSLICLSPFLVFFVVLFALINS